jgi:hypothetical protein
MKRPLGGLGATKCSESARLAIFMIQPLGCRNPQSWFVVLLEHHDRIVADYHPPPGSSSSRRN